MIRNHMEKKAMAERGHGVFSEGNDRTTVRLSRCSVRGEVIL